MPSSILPVTFLAFATFGLTLLAVALAAWRLGRKPSPFICAHRSQPVTIVRPLCGIERFSEATLRSGFRIDHPDYELVFCVASSGDPVIPLVSRLIERYPHVPARILVGDDRFTSNPKLNNCLKGWNAARHDWVILADSNVLMPRDYVGRMLAAWRPNSGLVCSTPIGSRPGGFWALIECAFLNTLQARWQYACEALGHGFAQGKSMLWFRPFLEAHGGIRALGSDIAEDAAATKLVRAAGLAVHLVDQPFEQPLGRRGMAEVWARQLRWARLRRVTFPLFFAPEILSSPLVPAAALIGAAESWTGGVQRALAMLLACYAAEMLMAWRAGWHLSVRTPLALLARDIAIPAIWLTAFLMRDVIWHGTSMRIAAGPTHAVALADSRS